MDLDQGDGDRPRQVRFDPICQSILQPNIFWNTGRKKWAKHNLFINQVYSGTPGRMDGSRRRGLGFREAEAQGWEPSFSFRDAKNRPISFDMGLLYLSMDIQRILGSTPELRILKQLHLTPFAGSDVTYTGLKVRRGTEPVMTERFYIQSGHTMYTNNLPTTNIRLQEGEDTGTVRIWQIRLKGHLVPSSVIYFIFNQIVDAVPTMRRHMSALTMPFIKGNFCEWYHPDWIRWCTGNGHHETTQFHFSWLSLTRSPTTRPDIGDHRISVKLFRDRYEIMQHGEDRDTLLRVVEVRASVFCYFSRRPNAQLCGYVLLQSDHSELTSRSLDWEDLSKDIGGLISLCPSEPESSISQALFGVVITTQFNDQLLMLKHLSNNRSTCMHSRSLREDVIYHCELVTNELKYQFTRFFLDNLLSFLCSSIITKKNWFRLLMYLNSKAETLLGKMDELKDVQSRGPEIEQVATCPTPHRCKRQR